MRRQIVVCLAGAASACSLFTSLNGLSNGDSADAGSQPSGDGGASEGGGDGEPAETGANHFCTNVDAGFCEDFDDPADPKWKRWEQEVGDGTTLLAAEGYSAPSSLEAFAPSFANGQQGVAHLKRAFGKVNRSRVAYRFRVEERDETGQVTPLVQIDCVNANGDRASVRLQLEQTGFFVSGAIYPNGVGGTFPQIVPDRTVMRHTWHSIDFTTDWTAKPAKISVTIDDAPAGTDLDIPGATFGPGDLELYVGIFYSSGPTTPVRARFDDVRVWTE